MDVYHNISCFLIILCKLFEYDLFLYWFILDYAHLKGWKVSGSMLHPSVVCFKLNTSLLSSSWQSSQAIVESFQSVPAFQENEWLNAGGVFSLQDNEFTISNVLSVNTVFTAAYWGRSWSYIWKQDMSTRLVHVCLSISITRHARSVQMVNCINVCISLGGMLDTTDFSVPSGVGPSPVGKSSRRDS